MAVEPGDARRSDTLLRAGLLLFGVVVLAGIATHFLGPDTSMATASSSASASPTSTTAQTSYTAAPVVQRPLLPAQPIGQRDWLLVAKDPAGNAGRRLRVFGRVAQFDAATGTSGFLAVVDGVRHSPGYVDYPTATAMVGNPGMLASLVAGDMFTAEVTVDGPYTYQTKIGGQNTVPKLIVTSIRPIS